MPAATRDAFLLEVQLRRERVPSFAAYPFDLPAVRTLRTLRLHPAVTFLVGENGSGKSTLLEALAVACGFNAEGGTRNFRFATRPSHSALHEYLRVVRGARRPRDGFFLRAESLFNVATEIERLGVDRSYGERPLHEQSHGESFLALASHRFGADGLFVLDEPEAALSVTSALAFLAVLHRAASAGAQFIVATHSPVLLAAPGARIYELDEEGATPVSWEDALPTRLTRAFVNAPERFLHELVGPATHPPITTTGP